MNRFLLGTAMAALLVACSGANGTEATESSSQNALANVPDKNGDPTSTPPDKSGLPDDAPGSCFTFDGGALCDAPDGKLDAEKICSAKGAFLTGLAPAKTSSCAVTCCTALPGPAAPPGACTYEVVGDGSACIDYSTLKDKAAAICEASGSELHAFGTADDCKGGATVAKIECCAPAKDPNGPPPPKGPDSPPKGPDSPPKK